MANKKQQRITNLIQLRNTLTGIPEVNNPQGEDGYHPVSAVNMALILNHIDKMLLNDGIHKV